MTEKDQKQLHPTAPQSEQKDLQGVSAKTHSQSLLDSSGPVEEVKENLQESQEKSKERPMDGTSSNPKEQSAFASSGVKGASESGQSPVMGQNNPPQHGPQQRSGQGAVDQSQIEQAQQQASKRLDPNVCSDKPCEEALHRKKPVETTDQLLEDSSAELDPGSAALLDSSLAVEEAVEAPDAQHSSPAEKGKVLTKAELLRRKQEMINKVNEVKSKKADPGLFGGGSGKKGSQFQKKHSRSSVGRKV